jgi:hypothetical protein
MINFNFVGDTSSGYTHRLDTYMSLLFTNAAVSLVLITRKSVIHWRTLTKLLVLLVTLVTLIHIVTRPLLSW